MRISDWSSDVCSSDLVEVLQPPARHPEPLDGHDRTPGSGIGHLLVLDRDGNLHKDVRVGADTIYHPGGVDFDGETDRKSGVEGKSVSVRVDLGGSRYMKKKKRREKKSIIK